MYKRRGVWITLVVTTLAASPILTAHFPLLFPTKNPLKIYPGNHAFIHDTGVHHPKGWEVLYRDYRPGYLARGLVSGGEVLTPGTYRYDFYFVQRVGHFAGLFSSANDTVRLEAADVTAQDLLAGRTLQEVDFKGQKKGLKVMHLVFSTWQRGGHRFEPRVYWQGLSGILLQRIELVPLGAVPIHDLAAKAVQFEDMMPRQFLENGYVVSRDTLGKPQDEADAAIWTGLYAACEAWRYRATQSAEARAQMEQSLWAMHALVVQGPLPGTLTRYVDGEGHALEQPASKDTYVGFFYAMAQGLPSVHNPALKRALLSDIEFLADHFLDHDLSFTSAHGAAVDFNPYPSKEFVTKATEGLMEDAALRKRLIRALRLARWYFWLHRQSAPPSFSRMIGTLKRPSPEKLQASLLPFANDLRLALKKVQKNVHRSAMLGPREGLTDTPGLKLDLLLLKTLKNLDDETGGGPLKSLDDLKILPSESLHALHILKVAGESLPKPNRFDTYYHANLYQGKALLKTAEAWHQFDEDAVAAVLGQTEVDTRRTASCHVSFLALHDLVILEKDSNVRFAYQKFFEDQFKPMQNDGNAMIDAMHVTAGLSADQTGLALWSLEQYPVDRRGKGDRFWKEHRNALLAEFGGEVNGQAREPLPPDLRPRDAFLWQRSAHSIRGDREDWLYPPLDYLFAYWLARSSVRRSAASENL